MKKAAAMVMILVLSITLLATTAFAAEARWENVAAINPSISSLDGCYASVITGLKGTTRIDCTMVLYEKSWLGTYREVSRTNEVYNGRMHEFIGYYPIKAGQTYKLEITAVVTCNGSDETVSCSFEK